MNNAHFGQYQLRFKDNAEFKVQFNLMAGQQGEIIGHLSPQVFKGQCTETQLILHSDGQLHVDKANCKKLPGKEVKNLSPMSLSFNLIDGQWQGTLTIDLSPEPDQSVDVYLEKTNVSPHINKSWSPEDLICPLITPLIEDMVDVLSLDLLSFIRPMSVCGPRTNGRGFYVFGSTAPPVEQPFLQNTVYYPFQWQLPSENAYSFTYELGDSIFVENDYTAATGIASILPFLQAIDIFDHNPITEALNELIPDIRSCLFGVSLIASSCTGNVSLIFNNNMGVTTSDFKNCEFAKIISSAFKTITGIELEFAAGKDIPDTWRLISGMMQYPPLIGVYAPPLFGTPLFMSYLFGTACVTYN